MSGVVPTRGRARRGSLTSGRVPDPTRRRSRRPSSSRSSISDARPIWARSASSGTGALPRDRHPRMFPRLPGRLNPCCAKTRPMQDPRRSSYRRPSAEALPREHRPNLTAHDTAIPNPLNRGRSSGTLPPWTRCLAHSPSSSCCSPAGSTASSRPSLTTCARRTGSSARHTVPVGCASPTTSDAVWP